MSEEDLVTGNPKYLFRDAINAWHGTAEKWCKFGAFDTEPRNVFANTCEAYHMNMNPDDTETMLVPLLTPEQWELYYSTYDCREAAAALNVALAEVCKLIREWGTLYYDSNEYAYPI